MPKNFEVSGPTFVGLLVRDVKASADFYEKKLGFRRDPEVFPTGVRFLTYSCELSNCFLLFLVSSLFHKEISQLFYTLFAAPRLRNLLIDLESLIVSPLATQRFCTLHSHVQASTAQMQII